MLCTNAKDYGAVGDGKTDDTRAIQRALDTEGAVCLPRGTFLIAESTPLVLDSSARLAGAGRGLTVLRISTSGISISGVKMGRDDVMGNQIRLEHLTIDGQKPDQTVTKGAVGIGGTPDAPKSFVFVRDVEFKDVIDSAVNINTATDIFVEGCTFENVGTLDITGTCSRIRIRDCTWRGPGPVSAGPYVRTTSVVAGTIRDLRIEDNVFLGLGSRVVGGKEVRQSVLQIAETHVEGLRILRNRFEQQPTSGDVVSLGGFVSDFVVSQNSIEVSGDGGIVAEAASCGTISDNVIDLRGQGTVPVQVGGGPVNVIGNQLWNPSSNKPCINIAAVPDRPVGDVLVLGNTLGVRTSPIPAGSPSDSNWRKGIGFPAVPVKRVLIIGNNAIGIPLHDTIPAGSEVVLAFNGPGRGVSLGLWSTDNLRGSFMVSGNRNSHSVDFAEAERDALYYLTVTPTTVSGEPVRGSKRVARITKSTRGFTVELESAPRGGSVAFDWHLLR